MWLSTNIINSRKHIIHEIKELNYNIYTYIHKRLRKPIRTFSKKEEKKKDLEITRNQLVIMRNQLVITRNQLVVTRSQLVLMRN